MTSHASIRSIAPPRRARSTRRAIEWRAACASCSRALSVSRATSCTSLQTWSPASSISACRACSPQKFDEKMSTGRAARGSLPEGGFMRRTVLLAAVVGSWLVVHPLRADACNEDDDDDAAAAQVDDDDDLEQWL